MPDLSQILLAVGIVVGAYLALRLILRVAGFAIKLALLLALAAGVYLLWSHYLR